MPGKEELLQDVMENLKLFGGADITDADVDAILTCVRNSKQRVPLQQPRRGEWTSCMTPTQKFSHTAGFAIAAATDAAVAGALCHITLCQHTAKVLDCMCTLMNREHWTFNGQM